MLRFLVGCIFLLCGTVVFSGCKDAIPKVTSADNPSSRVLTSSTQNFAAAGGTDSLPSAGIKIKFTMGYNQVGGAQSLSNGNVIRATSAGVANEQ